MFIDESKEQGFIGCSKKVTIINEQLVFVEDFKNIISVSSQQIILRKSQKKNITITGENLQISSLQPKTCEITGQINSVCFEAKK